MYARNDFTSKSPGDTITVPFPFLSRDHVYVVVDDSDVSSALYQWTSDGLLEVLSGFPSGDGYVERRTPIEENEASQTGGGVFDYEAVNLNDTQLLYVQQEAADGETDREARVAALETKTGTLDASVAAAANSAEAAANSAAGAAESAGILSSLLTGWTSFWQSVVTTANAASAWIALKVVGLLTSRTALKALTPSVGMVVSVYEDEMAADFAWQEGDFSTQVAIDTFEGIYVKADSVAATEGAWVRQYDGMIYAKWFRSTSGQAINAAINLLPVTGGDIQLEGGTYSLTEQLRLGDGNGGDTPSTRTGVKLRGRGGGYGVSGALVPTVLSWTGDATDEPMFSIDGMTCDISLTDMFIACNGLASGIRMTAFSGSTIERVKIVRPSSVGLAILGGEAPTGNYNIFNRFNQINIALLDADTVGVFMDGHYTPQNDTWISDFDLVRVEVVEGATDAACYWFKFVDSCSFRRCHADGGPTSPEPDSIGVIFDATDNNLFPAGMAFYDCSFKHIHVEEDGSNKIRKNYFYGFGSYDLEALPDHENIVGITDDGRVFGDFLYNKNWTTTNPTPAATSGSLSSASSTLETRQVGKFVEYRGVMTITNNDGVDTITLAVPSGYGNMVGNNDFGTGRMTHSSGGDLVYVIPASGGQTLYFKATGDTFPVGATETTIRFNGRYEVADLAD